MKNNIYILYSKFPTVFTLLIVIIMVIITRKFIILECSINDVFQHPDDINNIRNNIPGISGIHEQAQSWSTEMHQILNENTYVNISEIIRSDFRMSIYVGLYEGTNKFPLKSADPVILNQTQLELISLYNRTNCTFYLHAYSKLTTDYIATRIGIKNSISIYESCISQLMNDYYGRNNEK